MVAFNFPTFPTADDVVQQFCDASEQARILSPEWHARFEDLGVDPDPAQCLRLAASSPSPILAGFLFGQAAAGGFLS